MLITKGSVAFFLISSMVLGLLDQLQIFWQLYLVELLDRMGTWAVVFYIFKAFDRVWHAGLLHNLKSYGVSCQIIGVISSFLSNRWLQEVLYGAILGIQGILGPTLFLLYIDDLDDNNCNIAIYADDTALYSKRDQYNLICGNN